MSRNNQDLIPGPIEGYKMVNADMTCRGYKFELGKRHILPNNDNLALCQNGFHFCKYPSGVWSYYNTGRMFKIRAYGVLNQSEEPGADYKLVCKSIELYEEILIGGHSNTGDSNTGDRNTGDSNTGDSNTGDWNTGDWNTGHRNTGHSNTGDRNTGDSNTGDSNTGDRNTGDSNTGDRNTGDSNTGDRNTGDWNTGDWNTGDSNTGDWNTGSGNCGNWHSGSLCHGEAPFFLFNKKCNRSEVDTYVVNRLAMLLQSDNIIDPAPFLHLPNASVKAIKQLHNAHIKARRNKK